MTNKDFSDIIHMKGKMPELDVRKWYIAHDRKIGEQIDTSLSLEEQAREAHRLRNSYKYQARELMSNQEERKKLDKKKPLQSFEYYYKKYSKEYKTPEAIYKAIIDSSMRPNKKVNKIFNLD